MQKPSDCVKAGLMEIIPVLDALLDAPSESDFQRCTPRQLRQARAALNWICKVAYARPRSEISE